MSSESPELFHRETAQMLHGDVTETYALPEYASALVLDLISEYSRIYEKHFHDGCPVLHGGFYRPDTPGSEGQHLLIQGLAIRSYWGTDPYANSHLDVEPLEGELEKPNFEFGPVRVRWFKTPGRGMSTNVAWAEEQWAAWHEEVAAVIAAADVEL